MSPMFLMGNKYIYAGQKFVLGFDGMLTNMIFGLSPRFKDVTLILEAVLVESDYMNYSLGV